MRIPRAVRDHAEDQDTRNEEKATMSVSDQPSSAAELISWFLANGYSMTEIRGMFPAFFLSDPAPALVWNAVDWLRHWDSCGAMAALDSGFQECFDFTPTP